MIYGIVCVDKDWGIGYQNQLLFNIKEDMKFFRTQTLGKTVLMGLNTYYSIGKPLKNRKNIVLCPEGTELEVVTLVHSLAESLEELAKDEEAYIIGGASIYNLFLPYYDRVYVTKVAEAAEHKDVFFPNLDKNPNFIPVKLHHLTDEPKSDIFIYLKKEVA